MIKIEKGVLIAATKPGRKILYPFAQMEVGDSFVVTGDAKKILSAKAGASKWKSQNPGWDYGTSKVAQNEVRIWRTA